MGKCDLARVRAMPVVFHCVFDVMLLQFLSFLLDIAKGVKINILLLFTHLQSHLDFDV